MAPPQNKMKTILSNPKALKNRIKSRRPSSIPFHKKQTPQKPSNKSKSEIQEEDTNKVDGDNKTEDDHLHGFSTDEDSSDDESEVEDAEIDMGKLPSVAKDDETVKRKLDKAKLFPVRTTRPYHSTTLIFYRHQIVGSYILDDFLMVSTKTN